METASKAKFLNEEILAFSKILLDSMAFEKCKYTGLSIEFVLDILSTSRIILEDESKYIKQAEVFVWKWYLHVVKKSERSGKINRIT